MTSGFTGSIDRIDIDFEACQGANNRNNDLKAFVQQLVDDGKLTTSAQNIFNTRIVGDDNDNGNGDECASAREALLEAEGFERGFNIDSTKWTFIMGEQFDDEDPILSNDLLKERVEAQDVPIVRRVCPSCRKSHRDIYYRRLTEMPEEFDLLDTLLNNWFDTHNQHNVDFALYSSYYDAYYDVDRWSYCNFNIAGIGFPRDCGPSARVTNQWNSYTRDGGDAEYHAFLTPANPSFESETGQELFPRVNGADYVLSRGVRSTGTSLTYFSGDDYATYGHVNFGPYGTTKGIIVNYARTSDSGTSDCLSEADSVIGVQRTYGGALPSTSPKKSSNRSMQNL